MFSLTTLQLLGLVLSLVTTELFAFPNDQNKKGEALHHRMTKREITKYFGANSHAEVPNYEVISPFQADETGQFITHALHKRSRAKRDTGQPNAWFYNVKAFGLSLHLNVTKAKNIIAPGSIVETTHENGSKSYTTPPKNTFYSGHVVSQPGSTVAISNLDGLTGMINIMNQALFIHPLPSHLAQDYGSESGAQPHLIYKRSLKDVLKGCNVKEFQKRSKRSLESTRLRRSRDERSMSHKHLEVAMVADDLVVKRHGEEKLDMYLLMLAHLFDNMLHDESVGEMKLTLVVVKIVIKKDGLGYDSSAKNGVRLGKLTDWGIMNMPLSDKDPAHADLVVLLTGNGFGGLARMGSTCATQFGRTVNNDIGLASAIIIAHEAAHTFGLGHDGKGERCNNGEYIMASAVSDGENAFKWSPCSSKRIQEFLSGSGSTCLDDNPHDFIHEPSIFHHKLPGQIMNADFQCKLQYGPKYFQCQQKVADCGLLYCTKDGYYCQGIIAPPVDGTRCGDRHWCIKGECVDDGSPMIDGGWSDWQDTQSCSRSCGGGVQWKTRTCTNPAPQNGGRKCEGLDKGLWKMCNTQPCPKGSTDYRLMQCQAVLSKATAVKWEADPCLLSCRRDFLIKPNFGRVKDGTLCSSNPQVHDVCIAGICRPVGCDYKLDSGVMYDRCDVCGGNSSTCLIVEGTYTKNWRGWGPNNPDEIVVIPIGSTNVFAKMKDKTKNMLGVKDENYRWVYRVAYTWTTVVKAAGTRVAYGHEAELWSDTVEIPGPTKQALKIMYVRSSGPNPGMKYRFLSREKSDVSPEQVRWKTGTWTDCSEDCAGGFQRRLVQCVRKDDGSYVNDKMCLKTESKPPKEKACNTQPCASEWYISGWRPCSKTCGKGIQLRTIVCRRKVSQDRYEEDSSCAKKKPVEILEQECNKVACSAEWKHLSWSECSRSCGGGTRSRTLKCMMLDALGTLIPVSDHQCIHAVKPNTFEKCYTDITCPHSITGPDGKHFVALGCFRDTNRDRAVPVLVKNLRTTINWMEMEKTVKNCAHSVFQKNSTYKVFSVQFYGECWSGGEADKTYSEYGTSPNCWKGVGGSRTNFVYEFVDDNKSP